jgi:hypothetical protein
MIEECNLSEQDKSTTAQSRGRRKLPDWFMLAFANCFGGFVPLCYGFPVSRLMEFYGDKLKNPTSGLTPFSLGPQTGSRGSFQARNVHDPSEWKRGGRYCKAGGL